ncbi:MAG: hypothetical protein H7Y07_08045 [Pyrinomonadaceae bacterium]|nr:hypothetical protein [Sphingobacteriaceae bacterium]
MKTETLNQNLINEIENDTNVLMFADESSIFWVTNSGEYIWIAGHKNINEYVDESHVIEDRRHTDKSTEGVSNSGVYWMNGDFKNPFHISDFTQQIETINVELN